MIGQEQWRNFRSANSGNDEDGRAAWFAVQVKPRHDKVAAELLEQRGIVSFLPLYTSKRRWSDRVQDVEVPLFPGYLFALLDPGRRAPLLCTPGVVRLIGVGNTPVQIAEEELAAIGVAVQSKSHCEPVTKVVVGDRVRIRSGPLKGQEGVLTHFKNKDRLVLSISLVERSIAVEIQGDWLVERVSCGNRVVKN